MMTDNKLRDAGELWNQLPVFCLFQSFIKRWKPSKNHKTVQFKKFGPPFVDDFHRREGLFEYNLSPKSEYSQLSWQISYAGVDGR